MEENWIKVREINAVKDLSTQEYVLKQEKEFWKEILENEKFEYKFKIEEKQEYFEGSRTKGPLQTIYVLSLYAKENDLKELNKFLENIEKEEKLNIEKENNEEDNVNTEYEDLVPRKFGKYFVTILMIILIIFELMIIVYSFEETPGISEYIILVLFIITEIFMILKMWIGKKRKKNNE